MTTRGREAGTITGAWRSGRGPGTLLCCIIFLFLGSISVCRLYKITLTDQAEVTLQQTASLSGLV